MNSRRFKNGKAYIEKPIYFLLALRKNYLIMHPISFRPDQKLTDFLANHAFTWSAEVIPPRNGSEQQVILNQIQSLVEADAQFLAVTKGAGGSLRGGSLPIAQLIKEQLGIPCIAHFTCRDLTAADIENQLIDHHYFGIRNILALRGDPPDGQPHWETKPGMYRYAHELITQIKNLNKGEFLPRPNGPKAQGHESTDFCIGAAAYPEYPNETDRIEFFRIKAEAGAQFGITDMLFDPDVYARFRDQTAKRGVNIPILPGTRILKSYTQAIKTAEKFKVSIPKRTLDALHELETSAATLSPDYAFQKTLDLFEELVVRLRSLGAPGIHLFVINDTDRAVAALKRLKLKKTE